MKFNPRIMLYVLAFGIAFILWEKWQVANQPDVAQTPIATETASGTPPAPNAAQGNDSGALPPGAAPGGTGHAAPSSTPATAQNSADSITVQTDLLRLRISLRGGTITRAELLKYPTSKNSDQPLALMHENNPNRFILRSGLIGGAGDNRLPDVNAPFSAAQKHYQMADGQDKLQVTLNWQNQDGVQVEKIYTFTRGKYEFSLDQKVINHSDNPVSAYPYEQLVFGTASSTGGIGHVYTFTGGVTSTPQDPYNKIKLDDFAKDNQLTTEHGWIAMIQHYFLGALIPDPDATSNFYTQQADGSHYLGMTGQNQTIQPGSEGSFAVNGYIGPKIQSRLQAVAPGLDKTVDYGWLFMISQPMFYVLKFIHGIIGNWGWSIILMTLLIKLLFFAPSAWAYKSMAKMRRLQPQMQRLKERYGDDRQAMSQAMMELYRKEKVNPASGCLPMLLQIPFFIAFYWVLVESVELRQAPWIFWIQDLSTRDPYFILPIINAALMFVQQKLNPPPPDPMQAKIMMMLPLVFGFMFMWFPSGLVLYWTVSNAFSIVQQSIMNKRYGEPRHKHSHA